MTNFFLSVSCFALLFLSNAFTMWLLKFWQAHTDAFITGIVSGLITVISSYFLFENIAARKVRKAMKKVDEHAVEIENIKKVQAYKILRLDQLEKENVEWKAEIKTKLHEIGTKHDTIFRDISESFVNLLNDLPTREQQQTKDPK